jgi:hypothetical protein
LDSHIVNDSLQNDLVTQAVPWPESAMMPPASVMATQETINKKPLNHQPRFNGTQ